MPFRDRDAIPQSSVECLAPWWDSPVRMSESGAVSRRSSDETHPWPPNGDLRPTAALESTNTRMSACESIADNGGEFI